MTVKPYCVIDYSKKSYNYIVTDDLMFVELTFEGPDGYGAKLYRKNTPRNPNESPKFDVEYIEPSNPNRQWKVIAVDYNRKMKVVQIDWEANSFYCYSPEQTLDKTPSNEEQ